MQLDPRGEHSLGQDGERVCRQRVDPGLGADLGIGREEVGQLVIVHAVIVVAPALPLCSTTSNAPLSCAFVARGQCAARPAGA
jgi:hypothetical protein